MRPREELVEARISRESAVRPPEAVENLRGPSESSQGMVVADLERSTHSLARLAAHPRLAPVRWGYRAYSCL